MDKYAIQRKSVRFRLLLVGDNSPLTLQESIKPKQEKPSPSTKDEWKDPIDKHLAAAATETFHKNIQSFWIF